MEEGGEDIYRRKRALRRLRGSRRTGPFRRRWKFQPLIGYFWIRSGTNWAIADAKIRKLIWDLAFFQGLGLGSWFGFSVLFLLSCLNNFCGERDNRSDRWWQWQIGARVVVDHSVGRDYFGFRLRLFQSKMFFFLNNFYFLDVKLTHEKYVFE